MPNVGSFLVYSTIKLDSTKLLVFNHFDLQKCQGHILQPNRSIWIGGGGEAILAWSPAKCDVALLTWGRDTTTMPCPKMLWGKCTQP